MLGEDDPYEMDTSAELPPETGAFTLVDYAGLDNIVVWIEPQGRAAPSGLQKPPPVVIDVADPDSADRPWSIRVTSVGTRLVFQNRGSATACSWRSVFHSASRSATKETRRDPLSRRPTHISAGPVLTTLGSGGWSGTPSKPRFPWTAGS
jgi:hypothetical protein